MAFISTLDVVNACLATMGETPLNALDDDHPFVQAAINKLNTTNTQEQAKGWWFNTDNQPLTLDPETGYVYAPADAINVDVGDSGIVQRGRRLYDRTRSTFDIRIANNGVAPIQSAIVREIPFADLPMLAQHMISCRTQLDFQNAFDGDAQKYKELDVAFQAALITLRSEHIRNSKINLLKTPSAQSKFRLINPMSQYARRRW